jgi:hypothetical protein
MMIAIRSRMKFVLILFFPSPLSHLLCCISTIRCPIGKVNHKSSSLPESRPARLERAQIHHAACHALWTSLLNPIRQKRHVKSFGAFFVYFSPHFVCLLAKVKLNGKPPWRCNQPALGIVFWRGKELLYKAGPSVYARDLLISSSSVTKVALLMALEYRELYETRRRFPTSNDSSYPLSHDGGHLVACQHNICRRLLSDMCIDENIIT